MLKQEQHAGLHGKTKVTPQRHHLHNRQLPKAEQKWRCRCCIQLFSTRAAGRGIAAAPEQLAFVPARGTRVRKSLKSGLSASRPAGAPRATLTVLLGGRRPGAALTTFKNNQRRVGRTDLTTISWGGLSMERASSGILAQPFNGLIPRRSSAIIGVPPPPPPPTHPALSSGHTASLCAYIFASCCVELCTFNAVTAITGLFKAKAIPTLLALNP